jgi:hypothetical protein
LAPTVGQGRLESIRADFSLSSTAVGSDRFYLQHPRMVHYRRGLGSREIDVTALTLADCIPCVRGGADRIRLSICHPLGVAGFATAADNPYFVMAGFAAIAD